MELAGNIVTNSSMEKEMMLTWILLPEMMQLGLILLRM
jgi:hypothetical protein